MKKYLVLIFFIVCQYITSCAQGIDNGIYKNGDSFVCVKNDSIIICRNNYFNCYYGSYTSENLRIFLKENILLGRNATIDIEKASDNYIEIKLLSKYKNFIIGESIDNSYDTTIYQSVSPYYHILINHNKCIHSDSNQTIRIDKDASMQYDLSKGFLLDDDGRLSNFIDYYKFSLEFGNRYIFSQKYYPFCATLINEQYPQDFELIYKKHKIIQKFSNDYIVEYLFDNSNCDSCFNELKNKFPLLFE
ncbi:MAG: hypothetical protein IJK92_08180 [Bacteroidales bacterium]|nr:hypothetical protein [Bacteroidales bacterium]